MINLGRGEADEGAGALGGDLVRQLADQAGVAAGFLGCLLGCVFGVQVRLDLGIHGRDLDLAAIRQRDGIHTAQGRVAGKGQRAARRLGDGAGLAVVHVKLVLAAGTLHVGLTQEATAVRAHQQWQVGLFLDEGLVDQAICHDDLADAQPERRIAALFDRDVVIGGDGCGVVVGRDGDDFGAVVAGFGQEVIHRRHGVGPVRAGQEDQLGVEQVVRAVTQVLLADNVEGAFQEVADQDVQVRCGAAQHGGEAVRAGPADRAQVRVRRVQHEAVATLFFERVDDGTGDFGQRLVPGDTLPAPGAALAHAPQRVFDALVAVQVGVKGAALLAA